MKISLGSQKYIEIEDYYVETCPYDDILYHLKLLLMDENLSTKEYNEAIKDFEFQYKKKILDIKKAKLEQDF